MVDLTSAIRLMVEREVTDETSRLGDVEASPIERVDVPPPEGSGDPVIELEGDVVQRLAMGLDVDFVLSDELL